MTAIRPLVPRRPVPALQVPTVDGDRWTLAERTPENFTLILFYRGVHCPVCSRQLPTFEAALDRFSELGVEVIAVSMDTEERAREAKEAWELTRLTIGYGLSRETARDWGLYLTSSLGRTSSGHLEPEVFSEPGLFLVRPDGTLYWASVQTMPFARPPVQEILGALEFAIGKDYPARGELI